MRRERRGERWGEERPNVRSNVALLAESVTKSKKTLEGQGEPPQESPREQGALSVTKQ